MTDAALAIARTASLLLGALFALAALHKMNALQGGAAADEPLLAVSEWRRKWARPLLLSAAMAETMLVVGLLLWPAEAAAGSALLTAAYLRELQGLPAETPCNCLGLMMELPTRRLEIARNVLIILLSLGVLAAGVAGGALPTPSQPMAGAVVIILLTASAGSQVLALRALMRLPGARAARTRGDASAVPTVEVVLRGRGGVPPLPWTSSD